MPVTYNKVSQQQVAAIAETMLTAGEKLTQALMLMKQYEMDEAYLPWTAATLRSLNSVLTLGTQAISEIEEQQSAKRLGLPSRHDGNKKKLEYIQSWRERKQAEKKGKGDA